MKPGRPIAALVSELERQRDPSVGQDYRVNTARLTYEAGDADAPATLAIDGVAVFPLTPLAESQIIEWAGIPGRYSDRMRERTPSLYAASVNAWLQALASTRLVRVLDGRVRAFVPAGYRRHDNYDLMTTIAPVLSTPGVKILSAEVTSRRLYVYVTSEAIEAELAPDDWIRAGVLIRGSEVGHGTVEVEPVVAGRQGVYAIVFPTGAYRRYDHGAAALTDGVVEEPLIDDERAARDSNFWAGIHDLVVATLAPVAFALNVATLKAAAGHAMRSDEQQGIESVARWLGLSWPEFDRLANILAELKVRRGGAPLTQGDAAVGVAMLAHDADDYDVAYEFERKAGQLARVPARAWAGFGRDLKAAKAKVTAGP